MGIARPASTAPILGPDGQPLAGSIAEFETVRIGGVDQVLMLRGRSVDNPVLLYLAGGPGGTDIGAMRADVGLEQDFVVATWEQRGTGKSYASSIDPVEDLTLAQAVDDTIAVTDHLRERFGVDRVFLVANSWGTIPSHPRRAACPRAVRGLRGHRADGRQPPHRPDVLRGRAGVGRAGGQRRPRRDHPRRRPARPTRT